MDSRIWRSSLPYRVETNRSRACVGSAFPQRLSSASIAAVRIAPGRYFGDYVDKVFAGPKRLFPGPGGDAHESWQAGDIFCYRAIDGKCLLFQMIERVDLKPFVRSVPTVMPLD
jgi:hypothetical protein